MKSILFLIVISTLILTNACRQKNSKAPSKQKITLATIDSLGDKPVKPQNKDSILQIWHQYLANNAIKADTVLFAKVHYYLAKIYAMQRSDSAVIYIEKALEIIDKTTGNLNQKALIYNGVGNVWNSRTKEYQANFYYNKAATHLLADTGIKLSPSAKITILLSAAQSNKNLYQFELAQQMNIAALKLSAQLPKNHFNKQRPLTQIVVTLYLQEASPDSMLVYIKKLEALQATNPDDYSYSFLLDCKALYFERLGNKDSLLHYELLKNEIDLKKYQQKPTEQVFLNNLFTSYSNIGATYAGLKNAAQSKIYFSKADELYQNNKEIINTDVKILSKSHLAVLYELEGNYKKASQLLSEGMDLQKSNFKTKNTQAVAEMNTLYQLQAKDRSINNLSESIKIKALELEQNKLWLIIAVLAFVLSGILLFFFIKTAKQKRLLQEREQILLQQQLLRTQMEPHFIFNTLAALQSFVRLDKKEAAINYMNKFSRLLRSSLELSRENTVPLGQEVEALENYLNLQQMRFENAFNYEINLPAEQDMESLMLPPMLIQPFVENAILHGIDMNSKTGFVAINFTIKNDILEIIIKDSGKKNKEQNALAHRSLSGIISKERIGHLGKQANVSVLAVDEGTQLTLHIPVNY